MSALVLCCIAQSLDMHPISCSCVLRPSERREEERRGEEERAVERSGEVRGRDVERGDRDVGR